MTISSENRVAGPFVCNDVTVDFPFSFKVFSTNDVLVVLANADGVESELSIGADYTVDLNVDQDANPGGTVTTTAAYATGYTVTLTSQVANMQPVLLTNSGGFYPRVINDALDRLTILVQQVAEQAGRAVKVGISSSSTPDELIQSIRESAADAQQAADIAASIIEAFGEGGVLAIEFGGTGADNAADARTSLGLGTAATATLGTGPGQVPTADQVAGLIPAGLPAGTIIHVAQNTAPAGYLKANGALVNRTTYADLFAAIGETFGAGDGSTTFALPDLRGEFIRGWDDGRGIDAARAVGSTQGGANAPHTHGAGTLTTDSAGAHTHFMRGTTNVPGLYTDGIAGSTNNVPASVNTSSAGAHTHTISGSSASEGTEARPRNIALLACIKF